MADMGLAGMGGAAGAGDALAQIQQQRIQAAQLAQQDALTRLKFQEQADAVQARLEASRQAQQDRMDAAKATAQDRKDRLAMLQFQLTPVGAPVDPGSAQQQISAGIPSNLLPKTPGTPVQQTAGFMPMPSAPSTGPGMQTIQGLQPINGGSAPPAPTGPSMPPGGQSVTTSQPASPLSTPDTFTRGATQADLEKQVADKRLQQQLENTKANQDWQNSVRQLLADIKSNAQPTSSYQLQPEIDPATGKQTGRYLGYNTKLNRWEPVQGQGPESTKAAPGAAQQAQQTQFTHDALDSLGQLDKSLESVKDLVGPAAGRGETVEQWIGTADPKIQAFGTKLLLTKFRVDHAATGTARAGTSPTILARWDNLLAQKVSYDGLKAAVQAAKEILQGSGTSVATSGSKPTAAELIKKYGG